MWIESLTFAEVLERGTFALSLTSCTGMLWKIDCIVPAVCTLQIRRDGRATP